MNIELIYEMSFPKLYHCLFDDGYLHMENNFNSTYAIIVSSTESFSVRIEMQEINFVFKLKIVVAQVIGPTNNNNMMQLFKLLLAM